MNLRYDKLKKAIIIVAEAFITEPAERDEHQDNLSYYGLCNGVYQEGGDLAWITGLQKCSHWDHPFWLATRGRDSYQHNRENDLIRHDFLMLLFYMPTDDLKRLKKECMKELKRRQKIMDEIFKPHKK
jgi:hypothetical protein